MRLSGRSMTPCIPHGSVVTLCRLRRAPRLGEILMVDAGQRLVVHRLVDQADHGKWLRLQGDAHATPDPWIRMGAVLAAAVEIRWMNRILIPSPCDAPFWQAGGTLVRRARTLWRTFVGRSPRTVEQYGNIRQRDDGDPAGAHVTFDTPGGLP